MSSSSVEETSHSSAHSANCRSDHSDIAPEYLEKILELKPGKHIPKDWSSDLQEACRKYRRLHAGKKYNNSAQGKTRRQRYRKRVKILKAIQADYSSENESDESERAENINLTVLPTVIPQPTTLQPSLPEFLEVPEISDFQAESLPQNVLEEIFASVNSADLSAAFFDNITVKLESNGTSSTPFTLTSSANFKVEECLNSCCV